MGQVLAWQAPSTRLPSDAACSPLVLHKTHTEGGTQCQVPIFVFAHLCFLHQTKIEPKGKGNCAAPSEFVACVHATGQPKLGPLSIPSSSEN